MRRIVGTLLGLVLLVGCTTPAAPQPTAGSRPPSATAVRVVEITLADGRAEPNGERLELARGTTLELVITSDRHDSVHVHGYEVEIDAEPGATVRGSIVLDRTGRYEVESHEPALTILQLIVS